MVLSVLKLQGQPFRVDNVLMQVLLLNYLLSLLCVNIVYLINPLSPRLLKSF